MSVRVYYAIICSKDNKENAKLIMTTKILITNTKIMNFRPLVLELRRVKYNQNF